MLLRPGIDRRPANRIEQFGTAVAGNRPERHRRVGLPERGQPDSGDRLADLFGDNGERIQI